LSVADPVTRLFLLMLILTPAVAQEAAELPKLDPQSVTITPTPSGQDQHVLNEIVERLTAPIAAVKLAGDYGKWVNIEVAYIINDKERKAFLRLDSDDARDEFIEKFWETHNRDEHYHRFTYVKEQFGRGRIPGWQTLEGRTYIVMGAPDASEDTQQFLIWRYKKVAGLDYAIEVRFPKTAH